MVVRPVRLDGSASLPDVQRLSVYDPSLFGFFDLSDFALGNLCDPIGASLKAKMFNHSREASSLTTHQNVLLHYQDW
jgi:hypothetical protein